VTFDDVSMARMIGSDDVAFAVVNLSKEFTRLQIYPFSAKSNLQMKLREPDYERASVHHK